MQGKVQKNVQSSWGQAQDLLQTGVVAAQQALQENTKKASKNLQKAQKNLQKMQGPVQNSVQSSLAKTQDVLQTGLGATQAALAKKAAQAGKGLQQVKDDVSDMQESAQARAATAKRKKARARFLFRVGLLAGVVAILLYTPWPGSETRQRLASTGNKFSNEFKINSDEVCRQNEQATRTRVACSSLLPNSYCALTMNAPLVENLPELFEANEKVAYWHALVGLMRLLQQSRATDIRMNANFLEFDHHPWQRVRPFLLAYSSHGRAGGRTHPELAKAWAGQLSHARSTRHILGRAAAWTAR